MSTKKILAVLLALFVSSNCSIRLWEQREQFCRQSIWKQRDI